jgi:hypothetical protein
MTNSRAREVVRECGIVFLAVSLAAGLIHFQKELPAYDRDVVGLMVMSAILAVACVVFCVRTRAKH